MMEHGTIVEIRGSRPVLEMERSAHCGRCRACLYVGSGKMRVEVHSVPGTAVGDHVTIQVPLSRLRAILTGFVLPLAAVLLGAALGNQLTGAYFPQTRYPNLLAIVLAMVLVVLTYLGVYLYERSSRSRRSNRPYIRTAK